MTSLSQAFLLYKEILPEESEVAVVQMFHVPKVGSK